DLRAGPARSGRAIDGVRPCPQGVITGEVSGALPLHGAASRRGRPATGGAGALRRLSADQRALCALRGVALVRVERIALSVVVPAEAEGREPGPIGCEDVS